MSKSTTNTGEPWSTSRVSQLKQLAKENSPTRVIGLKLGRMEDAIRSKATEKNISIKLPNHSQYDRT